MARKAKARVNDSWVNNNNNKTGWVAAPSATAALCYCSLSNSGPPQGLVPGPYLVVPRPNICSLSSVWQSFEDCRLLDYSPWHSISGRLRLQSRFGDGVRVRTRALHPRRMRNVLGCHGSCSPSPSWLRFLLLLPPRLVPAYLHLSLAGSRQQAAAAARQQRQHFCMQIQQTPAPRWQLSTCAESPSCRSGASCVTCCWLLVAGCLANEHCGEVSQEVLHKEYAMCDGDLEEKGSCWAAR